MTKDLAGKNHWDQVWAHSDLPTPIDPQRRGASNVVNRTFDEFFAPHFAALPPGARLIEVGCGRSAWLPYFAKRFGLHVTGVDYSARGCALARDQGRREGVDVEVIEANVFDPPGALLGAFDVVVSFGVVEHFRDTAVALSAVARLARPDGLVVTEVPNLSGSIGRWLRRVDLDLYAKHMPLSLVELVRAHQAAGVEVHTARHLVPIGFGMIPREAHATMWGRRAWGLARSVEKLVLKAVDVGMPVPNTRAFSPYLIVAGTAP